MLKVTGLYARYDEAEVLHDVGFSAADGERVALIGANGAGKSTLLLCLAGVLAAARGEIVVGGVSMTPKTLAEARQKLGMVFQNPDDQLFMPEVYEDIAFGPRNHSVPQREIAQREIAEHEIETRIDGVLRQLGITHLKNRMTHRLSGGEKRLVALAGVLVMSPTVLLMDEPTSFLDPRARRGLIGILNALPHTMLIATHDMDMAQRVCGRVILLKEGRVCADKPAAEVLDDGALLEECGL